MINDIKIEDDKYSIIIKEMLGILTCEERDAIIYKYWYGLSLAEIGGIIKKPKTSTLYYINSIEDKIREFYNFKI